MLAACLSLCLLFVAAQAAFEYQIQRARIVDELQDTAKAFAPVLASTAWDYQPNAVGDIVGGIGRNPVISRVHMQMAAGFPASQWTEADAGRETPELSVTIPLEFTSAGVRQKLGTLTLASDTSILWARVREAMFGTVLFSVVQLVLVALLVGSLLRRLVVTPLTEFSNQLRGFDSRTLLPAGALRRAAGREFFVLHTTFARMARQAARSRAALQRSHDVLEERVVERTRELASANEAKSRFLANMSHEIRTPLHAVLGMLALLRRTVLDLRQQDLAAKAESAARTLLQLINEVLDFSKIEAGHVVLHTHAFAPTRLFEDLGVVLEAYLGPKPVALRFELDPRLPPALSGDAMHLQQVLVNLGGNAIKFTERGEVCIGAQVLTRYADAVDVRFEVRDSGIGIAPEQLERIFSAFSQAEASTARRFGGTGLGLAISRYLVELMGGELAVTSTPGQGSRFFFRLHLLLADPNLIAPSAGAHASADAPRLDGLELLVVDDSAMNQQVARELLESEGATVRVASDGPSAIAELGVAGARCDLVLMDIQMPGMDGFEASRRIRALPGRERQPIVALSASAFAQDRAQSLAAGLDDHLGKPFDIDTLVAVIRRVVAVAPPAAGADAVAASDAATAATAPAQPAPPPPTAAAPAAAPRAARPIVEPSAATRVAAADAGVDLDTALARMGRRASIYAATLRTFLDGLDVMHARMLDATLGAEEALRLAHSLKGQAATLGAMPLAVQAGAVELLLFDRGVPLEAEARAQQMCDLAGGIAANRPALARFAALLQADAMAPALAAPPASAADGAAGRRALHARLRDLAGALQESDMRATDLAVELRERFGAELGTRAATLEALVAALDFRAALDQVRELIEEQTA
ncbi:MAG: response regulator [Pelomonas sp.]|nr:response regulator [Roseateles sp.]